MRLFLPLIAVALACQAQAQVDRSDRPAMRPAVTQSPAPPPAQVPVANLPDLQAWAAGFRPRALAEGIPPEIFDRALASAEILPDVVRRDRNQSEFTKTLWDYLETAVSPLRVQNGRTSLARHRDTLEAIEARYGVPKEIVVAVWGLESAYGTFRGETRTISALATLAAEGRRARFFEAQLIAAMRILAAGDVDPNGMRGSWAGAMGHTQFMPTSYLEHAVDFTGDGRRNIWGDDPTDALASTANYLRAFGWRSGEPWGMEVRLPDGFDFSVTGEQITKPAAEWARMGVTRMDGSALPANDRVSILVPAGAQGAAFARYPNFAVIERYNPADAYVIGVGHLADRIAGGPAIAGDWPRGDRALTFAERQEMQRLLAREGFDPGGVDGRVGPLTLAAIRAWQSAEGMTPDGYLPPRMLDRLRR
ncbi:lytic murein transglycosylase [Jannaschia aquimarina]|uniref:MltB_3 protein n=1 Tax=Jannaschia aquimarina TaxID=935700 RepID=A0A0D1ED71_9RHOB|nr:lytic murein transglycosylase [Jannaschia aquimarina]KIT15664.1 Membrane-bound lytic murein transglycosylase B precursor [Jannaschia aquimarina]SNT39423.1 membrane-bound lytic murein transglycosylase B [Jannaschia aquimarina]